ncbi:MAG: hypothetical protein NVS3B10_27190 [Polyangiales bacterium]
MLAALVLLLLASSAGSARADDAEPAEVVEARAAFVTGTDLAKRSQWAEALTSFSRSASLRPHAVTTYNLAICHRAMGNYTLARRTFEQALADSRATEPPQMPAALVAEAKTYTTEIDGLLSIANVRLSPANAAIAVDGRPLEVRGDRVLVAGVRPPGQGEPPPAGEFRLLLNPGTHVFTVSRAGFADAVVNKTMIPGATTPLDLELDRLPATIHVVSSQDGAVVAVNGLDIGIAPLDVSRPAGNYRVIVRKSGFKAYDQQLAVQPGQEIELRAPLSKDEVSLTSRWWFWTAAGVLVTGVAAGTYALTRTESTHQQPLDGGGLGWAAKIK